MNQSAVDKYAPSQIWHLVEVIKVEIYQHNSSESNFESRSQVEIRFLNSISNTLDL